MPSPGLYMINSTGETTALHTGDGGDEALLREYLQEWDIDGIEVTIDE